MVCSGIGLEEVPLVDGVVEAEVVHDVVGCAVVVEEEDGEFACGGEVGGSGDGELEPDDAFGSVVLVADPWVGAVAFAVEGYAPVVDLTV